MGQQDFRDAMAGVCAPVTIVTAAEHGTPYGVTVSAFASLSLRPPMVSVALNRSSDVLRRILATGRFGVNVLSGEQDGPARTFARRLPDRFAASGAPWTYDHGLPRLTDAPGWLVCDLRSAVEGGDHLLLLGDVTHVRTSKAAPLVYGHRTFGTHSAFAR
ncbi:flavin reductase family protein [Streptomyces mobaraensis]|uniref:Flavin reductase family protein n=1 Tax=Streptomyces mobaraensis TaxID=35621 RepID=A0A5N5W4D3_STRMB|nr:flavin reductase family protein [Streptomyces mobaraensis]KAB7839614.1 flavin reductase family protein [Streptomyces mobaraensis]